MLSKRWTALKCWEGFKGFREINGSLSHVHARTHTLLLLAAYFHQIITNSVLPAWLNIEKPGREEDERKRKSVGNRAVWGRREELRVEEEEDEKEGSDTVKSAS